MTVTFRLDDSAVAVAGASRGIGAACAVACAAAGAPSVALLARDRDALDRVAADVRAAGARALALVCDVAAAPRAHAVLDGLERVDVLVVCAGVNRPGPFLDVDEAVFDRLFGVNVRGAFFVAQAAARGMVRRGRGAIVFVSSQMGHVGAPDRSVYCASKHAVEGLTKALAVELAPAGVRVVSVAPTFVRTAMTAAQLDDPATGAELVGRIPIGRCATPEEVAAAVVYAASPAAAATTGCSLLVDGGWTAR